MGMRRGGEEGAAFVGEDQRTNTYVPAAVLESNLVSVRVGGLTEGETGVSLPVVQRRPDLTLLVGS